MRSGRRKQGGERGVRVDRFEIASLPSTKDRPDVRRHDSEDPAGATGVLIHDDVLAGQASRAECRVSTERAENEWLHQQHLQQRPHRCGPSTPNTSRSYN